jgi:hypothetical protein
MALATRVKVGRSVRESPVSQTNFFINFVLFVPVDCFAF